MVIGHFGPKTLGHLGRDSSALRSELSLGHFGTSADLSGQFGPTKLVPKCPRSEVSWVRSVRNSAISLPHSEPMMRTLNLCLLALKGQWLVRRIVYWRSLCLSCDSLVFSHKLSTALIIERVSSLVAEKSHCNDRDGRPGSLLRRVSSGPPYPSILLLKPQVSVAQGCGGGRGWLAGNTDKLAG